MEIDLFNLETIEALTIYSFLLIIFLIIIRYFIFAKDIGNRNVAKVIGGFSVFIVAIISQSSPVIFVSLFIGGLLIATEDFMKQLAIIFRSRSEDIGENLKPVSATPQEVKEKQKQEIQETVEVQEGSLETDIKDNRNIKAINFKSAVHGEKALVLYLRRKYGSAFLEDIKFETTQGKTILVDGILLNKNRKLISLIEIRVLKSTDGLDSLLTRTVVKVREIIPDLPLHVCFVFIENVKKRDVQVLNEFVKNFNQVYVSIFSLKNDKLETIVDTNL